MSSNLILSLEMTTKTSIGLVMFIVGRSFFSNYLYYSVLLKYFLFLYVLLVVSVGISNITGIGMAGYGENTSSTSSVYFGDIGVAITKLLVLPILITPVFLRFMRERKWKITVLVTTCFAIIITLIAFKRSSTIAFIGGILIYAVFLNKKTFFTYLLSAGLLLIISFPFYQNQLITSYNNRSKQLYGISKSAESIEQEARYWETLAVFNAFNNDGVKHQLIGSELFNEFEYFKTRRMLHIDFIAVLNGSGAIGLILFVSISLVIFFQGYNSFFMANDDLSKLISISIMSIIVFSILISLGGSIRSFDFRGPIFLYLGASIGLLSNKNFNLNKSRARLF